MCSLISIERKL
ncbi:TPA: hypothetical protein ANIA_11286 [Aspergillus nidulans FGSC A4]|uniref:Uncharacterized protein n=1 Tax=Emericella nidulans (strain FGSC A4 / ATCC 38163 / CBS 112.46 / NRRL 194 / M139) TaxID=227321 RepID=C8VU88_EMENI|nr:TPA: hypothetical protein ANIA_11286 [Aspergillus nidulans FGSC A4]